MLDGRLEAAMTTRGSGRGRFDKKRSNTISRLKNPESSESARREITRRGARWWNTRRARKKEREEDERRGDKENAARSTCLAYGAEKERQRRWEGEKTERRRGWNEGEQDE